MCVIFRLSIEASVLELLFAKWENIAILSEVILQCSSSSSHTEAKALVSLLLFMSRVIIFCLMSVHGELDFASDSLQSWLQLASDNRKEIIRQIYPCVFFFVSDNSKQRGSLFALYFFFISYQSFKPNRLISFSSVLWDWFSNNVCNSF